MLTLVYKRTHHGDPNEHGLFGCYGCMGKVRSWEFEAVIGIGGLRPWPEAKEMAKKVNWVGIERHKAGTYGDGCPIWAFNHFHYFGTDAPLVSEVLPLLVRRMYAVNVRAATTFGPRTQGQIDDYLEQFRKYPSSTARPPDRETAAPCRTDTRRPRC